MTALQIHVNIAPFPDLVFISCYGIECMQSALRSAVTSYLNAPMFRGYSKINENILFLKRKRRGLVGCVMCLQLDVISTQHPTQRWRLASLT